MFVDNPSWCDGSLAITPPNEDDVHEEAVVLVGRLSVAVALLFLADIVVRCIGCLSEGVEEIHVDEGEVVSVDCCTDGHEELINADADIVGLGCVADGLVALTPDDVADR